MILTKTTDHPAEVCPRCQFGVFDHDTVTGHDTCRRCHAISHPDPAALTQPTTSERRAFIGPTKRPRGDRAARRKHRTQQTATTEDTTP